MRQLIAFISIKGNVIFTVDFSKAEIVQNESELHISIPEPQGELIIDQNQIEKVAEYQKHFWSGSAGDGFRAYLKSMKEIDKKAEEKLVHDEKLLNAAKDSARRQIQQLANSMTVSNLNIEVKFIKAKEKTPESADETKEDNYESAIQSK